MKLPEYLALAAVLLEAHCVISDGLFTVSLCALVLASFMLLSSAIVTMKFWHFSISYAHST